MKTRSHNYWGLGVVAALLLAAPAPAQDERPRKGKEFQPKLERAKFYLQSLQTDDKERPAVDKARAELQEMMRHIERMQTQLREAQAQMRQAMERLGQLEGERPARPEGRPEKPGARVTIVIQDAEGNVRKFDVPPGSELLRRIASEGLRGDTLKRFEEALKSVTPPGGFRREGFGPFGGPGPRFGPPEGEGRMRELEKRLDSLQHELEELRKAVGPRKEKAPPPERKKEGKDG